MRYDWFVEKWLNGEYVSRMPWSISKRDAESLAKAGAFEPGIILKAVHRSDLQEKPQ